MCDTVAVIVDVDVDVCIFGSLLYGSFCVRLFVCLFNSCSLDDARYVLTHIYKPYTC